MCCNETMKMFFFHENTQTLQLIIVPKGGGGRGVIWYPNQSAIEISNPMGEWVANFITILKFPRSGHLSKEINRDDICSIYLFVYNFELNAIMLCSI